MRRCRGCTSEHWLLWMPWQMQVGGRAGRRGRSGAHHALAGTKHSAVVAPRPLQGRRCACCERAHLDGGHYRAQWCCMRACVALPRPPHLPVPHASQTLIPTHASITSISFGPFPHATTLHTHQLPLRLSLLHPAGYRPSTFTNCPHRGPPRMPPPPGERPMLPTFYPPDDASFAASLELHAGCRCGRAVGLDGVP